MTIYAPTHRYCGVLTAHASHLWRDGPEGRGHRCPGHSQQQAPVDLEAQVSRDLLTAAQDLYRGMNEGLSQELAWLSSGQREWLFTQAALIVEQDLEAGRPPDLLRALTEAALLVDPAYDSPGHDPTQPASEHEDG